MLFRGINNLKAINIIIIIVVVSLVLLLWKKALQVRLHAVIPPNDWLCTRWTDLGLKFFVAASTDEMASRALHDPGVMGDDNNLRDTLRQVGNLETTDCLR